MARRANAGWRGFSVDLADDGVEVPADARLHGGVVRRIWALSRLGVARLGEIWDECVDPAHVREGLDRGAFARGMWRIDEELRRARLGALGVEAGKTGSSKARRIL